MSLGGLATEAGSNVRVGWSCVTEPRTEWRVLKKARMCGGPLFIVAGLSRVRCRARLLSPAKKRPGCRTLESPATIKSDPREMRLAPKRNKLTHIARQINIFNTLTPCAAL